MDFLLTLVLYIHYNRVHYRVHAKTFKPHCMQDL